MSGGYFDYQQYRLHDMADSIREVLNERPEPGDPKWSEHTRQVFKLAIKSLLFAELYVQRIDWLLSGDDSEETFHRRLNRELKEMDAECDFIKAGAN
jgi:hypothetical protein